MMSQAVERPAPNAGRRRTVRVVAAATAGAGLLFWSLLPATAALPSEGFADLAAKVTPAVVNISTTHAAAGGMELPPGASLEDLLRRYNEQMQPENAEPVTALGSGFVISADGYVVTNNHVIEGAESITVNFADGESLEASVVGTDPQTDVALLKVESEAPLPYVAFGDSDAIRVGDYVMAVGNPFGLGGTVTAGIVSARGRDIHAGPYDDFIQTDAAINRGNSGGPMFNLAGDVVGINSAIVSPNGGSVGIGFAIPANLAKDVIADLQEKGTVERGWLGVRLQPMTEDLAEAFGLESPEGALVAEVLPGTPAEAAQVRQGDVILSFAGHEIRETRDLVRAVAMAPVGEAATLEIWRDGKAESLTVTIGQQQAAAGEVPAEPAAFRSDALGALLAPVDETLRAELGLAEDAEGVAIVGLEPDGRAAEQGLAVGDVIERVAGTAVTDPAALDRALTEADGGQVLVLVNRGGVEEFVAIPTEAA